MTDRPADKDDAQQVNDSDRPAATRRRSMRRSRR